MIAIILAAGSAKRMGGLVNELPKGLLALKENVSPISRSLDLIDKYSDIKKVIVITGYRSENIENSFSNKYKSLSIEYLFNSDFNHYNNAYSVYLAKEKILNGFLLINSDTIFHSKIFETICKSNKSVLMIDAQKNLADEEMKVSKNAQNLICKISKNLPLNISFGEYIGITKFYEKEAKLFCEYLTDCIENKKEYDFYYEDVYNEMIKNHPLNYVITDGYPWIEIDFPADYEKAITLNIDYEL